MTALLAFITGFLTGGAIVLFAVALATIAKEGDDEQ